MTIALSARAGTPSPPRSHPRRSRRARASPPTSRHGPAAPHPAPARLRTRTGPGAAPHPLVGIDRHRPRARLQLAAQDLHERRLAAAVGADQAIAVPVAGLHGDVREKGLGPELHGHAEGDDHWGSRNKKAGLSQLGLGLTARAHYVSASCRSVQQSRFFTFSAMTPSLSFTNRAKSSYLYLRSVGSKLP